MANLPTSLNWLEDFGEQALAYPALQNAHLNSIEDLCLFYQKLDSGYLLHNFLVPLRQSQALVARPSLAHAISSAFTKILN